MQNFVFDFATLHGFGSAFVDFLALRKRILVDGLGWDIPHDEVLEMDQYDNPTAHYSIVTIDGRVVAGARTMATSARWGETTCMLRDAAEGRLTGFVPGLYDPSMTSPTLWECTRLVIADDLQDHGLRLQTLALLVDGLVRAAAANGGTDLISLSPLPLQRALKGLGHDVRRISDPYTGVEDGRKYAVMTMPAVRQLERLSTIDTTLSARRQALHAAE